MRIPLLMLVLLASPVKGQAQMPDRLQAGNLVRIRFDCRERRLSSGAAQTRCRRERGVVVAADARGLTWRLEPEADPDMLPWSSIRSVDVSLGTRRATVKGLTIGAIALGVPGIAFGAVLAGFCECEDPEYVAGGIIGGVFLGGVGALLGAGIGALVRTERWENVSPQWLRASVEPRRGGLGVGLAVRF